MTGLAPASIVAGLLLDGLGRSPQYAGLSSGVTLRE